MQIQSIKLLIRNKEINIHPSITRKDLIEYLGEPDDYGACSRKNKRGCILLYELIEFHFSSDKDDSMLQLVYKDNKERVELSIPFNGMVYSLQGEKINTINI
ncbi:MAG: hypothetical protein WC694_03560 [Candidatus Paceibacterota bacterium]|jgi:hypothetical protein